MVSAVADLIGILDLEPLEVNLFRGRSPQSSWQRVFGGQTPRDLGQSGVQALKRRRFVVERLDADPADAAAIHFFNREAAIPVVNRFAGLGDVTEAHEDKSGQSFHASFSGQVPLHLRFKISQIYTSIKQEHARGGADQGASGIIELVFQFSG